MKNILIAGASGILGLEITKALSNENYHLRLHTSSDEGAKKLSPYSTDVWKVSNDESLDNITQNIDLVISALGNSISLFTKNDSSFYETDFDTNKDILKDAERNSIKRFIYVSIKGAEENEKYTIPGSNRLFEMSLEKSGIKFSIIRPVGMFSGLHDLAIMSKRNIIPVIGDGKAKTNSIHQKDLAYVIKDVLRDGPEIMEIGGPEIHTRLEMAEMISKRFNAKIVKIPDNLAALGVAFSSISNDIHDKLENFKYITTHDMIGEKYGAITFEEYLKNLDEKDLP